MTAREDALEETLAAAVPDETRDEQFPPPEPVPAPEPRTEVSGVMMTRPEWKRFMEQCPHEHFTHAGVELMDGSPMSICDRCKFIQHEAIAKIIEGQEEF